MNLKMLGSINGQLKFQLQVFVVKTEKIILLKKTETLFLQPFAEVAQLVRAQDS